MKKRTTRAIATIFITALFFVAQAQIVLEKQNFFGGKVEMLLPKEFTEVPIAVLEKKYPDFEGGPSHLFTDESTEVNLIIDNNQGPLTEAGIEEMKDYQVKSLKELLPASNWKSDGVKMLNGKKVGYFKFIGRRAQEDIFNYFFFTNFGGKTLLVTFNCTMKKMSKWEPIAEKIFASFTIKE